MLTAHDTATILRAFASVDADNAAGTYDGPETVMLSTGYADVHAAGWVVQHRVTIAEVDGDNVIDFATLAGDGCVATCPVCGYNDGAGECCAHAVA